MKERGVGMGKQCVAATEGVKAKKKEIKKRRYEK